MPRQGRGNAQIASQYLDDDDDDDDGSRDKADLLASTVRD